MSDSLRLVADKPLPVHILDDSTLNWNLLTLIVAALSLIAAVLLPFAQKKYEERKAKLNFKTYIKSQFGYLFSLATYEKIPYIRPSISDEVVKEGLTYIELARKIKYDFEEFKGTTQPRVQFFLIQNLQQFCFQIYQIKHYISKIDTIKLKENILANGEKLSKVELNKIYGLITTIENFGSISTFHDRFRNLKSIQRDIRNNTWVGFAVKKDIFTQQQVLGEDLHEIYNNESSLQELLGISAALHSSLFKYYKNK